MPPSLQLHVKEFRDESHWRWELQDDHGRERGIQEKTE